MTIDDLILVSVDDHLIEPADMFDRHIPARFKGSAPRIIITPSGAHHWEIEGKRLPGMALNAVAGRPREEFGMEPITYEHIRAGCYDIHARIGDMNANGVLGSICFATFPGFAGARFQMMQDKELAIATIRAYNDWHIGDWCGAYPERFIPIVLLPLWDPHLAAIEIARTAALGSRTIAFPENPANLGLPSLHSAIWEPVWKACSDHQMVISCHFGSSGGAVHASDESPISAWITTLPIAVANAAADWMFAGFWSRYPTLRIALSEGGIGWIPYLLERADFTFSHHGPWTHVDLGGRTPSEIFKEHFITCFIEDEFGMKNHDAIGIDRIMWESDYPHSDGVWPYSPERLWPSIKHLSKEQTDKVTHLNAMREFRYNPISALGSENCTVAALRRKAAGVDVTLKSLGGLAPQREDNRPVTSGDVKKILNYA